MLNTRIRSLAAMVALVLVVAGCGGDAEVGTDDPTSTDAEGDTARPVMEPKTVAPSDGSLRYTGRWDTSDPDAPWAGSAGSSVAFRFEGTDVSVTLDPGGDTEWFRVVVDGDQAGSVKLAVEPGRATYPLALGLPYGVHGIELVKETNRTDSTFLGFELVGSEWTEAPPAPTRRIEFYGDSNLAGHSLEHEQDQTDPELVGTHFGYAGITARMFDAAYHNISWSGSTISGMHAVFDALDRDTPDAPWDFAAFPADVVVVNLGANDVAKPVDDIKADYHAFLDDLRATHPDAHIVVYNAWGWSAVEPANYTWEVVESRGDPNMSVATFPWLFEQWHGSEYDHGGMAQVLAAHLEETLGWTAWEQDVMSGFGQNGDVANGGFEQVAPFGGYGWRYKDEPGVARVIDATRAHGGEAFLELADGAETHQPNPATNGQTVTVTAWVRGAAEGDTLAMTIDFRDQTMWTQPLASTTEVFTLDTDWQQITLQATAPEDPDRAVFHTRLTLGAGEGSVVHVDDIDMTRVDGD